MRPASPPPRWRSFGLRAENVGDCRGPAPEQVRAILRAVTARPAGAHRARDLAIVRLLADLGLRRSEVAGLDLEHVNLKTAELQVLGKGRAGREPVALPRPTCDALRAWVEERGAEPGPLFVALQDPRIRGRRLSGVSVWNVVQRAAKDAGVEMPRIVHGLRHAAVTAALDAGFDPRKVRHFSRHASIATVQRYDDARQEGTWRREIAAAVAGVNGDHEVMTA